ncbi:MAG: ATP-binding protein [Ginsengibacter sp.]
MSNIFLKNRYPYILLGLIVVLVYIVIILQNKNDATIQDTRRMVDHTYEILNQSGTIQSLSRDMQSNDRGYVITGDSSFIPLIDSDAIAVIEHIDEISALTWDNPHQQKRIDSLYGLVKQRISLSRMYVNARNSVGIIGSAQLMALGESMSVSEHINAIINRVSAEETVILAKRKAANANSIERLKTYFYIPFIFITLLLVITTLFMLIKMNTGLKKMVSEKSAELQKRANKFETLLENSFDGIVLLNEDLTYAYRGYSAEKITGFSIDEQDTKTKGSDRIHPEDKEEFHKIMQDVLDHPDKSYQSLYRSIHKNGHYIWIEAIITNRLKNQDVQAIVFNIRDVSARVEMEQQKQDFLTMVSHELRTPVTSLKVLAHILQEKFFAKPEEENTMLLTKLNEQTNKLMRIINDIIDINKLDVKQLSYHLTLFRLDNTVNNVIADLNRLSLSHQIIKEGFEEVEIVGDQDRIVQLLTNLILNAIKYSPGANKVFVTLRQEKGNAIFSIKDEGIGIDMSESEKIFQRFYRSSKNNVRTYPGFGIGLYVSLEIIKAHDGKIWVESKPGEGSVFYFSIPLPSSEKRAIILN